MSMLWTIYCRPSVRSDRLPMVARPRARPSRLEIGGTGKTIPMAYRHKEIDPFKGKRTI